MTELDPETRAGLKSSLHDPVKFARKYLRADLWPLQAEILRSIASHPRTAVKACHSSGKTYLAAHAVIWWLARFEEGIVITTAPTWIQVEKLIWGEIHAALARSRIPFPAPSRTELRIGARNYAMGISTNEGVRFQGHHGTVLVILDEAPGVKPEIWEAIEGIRAGGDVRVLALGNPTDGSGPFYDAFTRNRDHWATYTISAFDTPNMEGVTLEQVLAMSPEELATNPRPYLTLRSWVREKFHEWGPGHPMWEARVLGAFPANAVEALIPLSWIERAGLEPEADDNGPLDAGIDVAGPGEDETVLILRSKGRLVKRWAWSDPDARGAVKAALREYYYRLQRIRVDCIGLGYYFALEIRDMFETNTHCTVELVNVAEASDDPERYKNKKAEYYWGLRMRFEANEVHGVTDRELASQLSTLRYSHNARGQIEIESKEDALKRGVKSPDRAEALMLSFAGPAEMPGVRAIGLGPARQRADFSEVA